MMLARRSIGVLLLLVASAGTARAQWGTETPLTATGFDVWGEGIAAAGDTLHVVYGSGDLRYRRSTDQGATWASEDILGDGTLHLTDPIVADGDDVWIVYLANIQVFSDWCCPRDSGNLWMLHSGDGGDSWDPPMQVSTPSTAFRYSIAYAANRLHLVWMDYRDDRWDTYYRRSPDRGETWDPEEVIAQGEGVFGAERPQVAARGDSVHVTIWDDRDPNPPCTPGSYTFPQCPDTFHLRSTDGGESWGAMTNVANGGAYFSGRNDVAVAGASAVVINYNVDVPGETGSKLFVVASDDDGATWGTPARLTYAANASDHGSIIGADGGVYLVWHDDRNPGNREIYYRRSGDGGVTWDDEEQVSTDAAGDSSTPLGAVTSGHAHVIWIDNRGGSYQVYYRRRALPADPTPDAGPGDGETDGGETDGGAPDAGDDDAPGAEDGGGGCGCTSSGGAASGSLLLALVAFVGCRWRRSVPGAVRGQRDRRAERVRRTRRPGSWISLHFSPHEAVRYSYEYILDESLQRFIVRGYGDLDCDGVYSTFEHSGDVRPGEEGPAPAPALTRVNELE